MATVKQWYLTNTLAGHSKFYEVVVEEPTPAKYEVRARYGRIGTAGKWKKKVNTTTQSVAVRAAEQLVQEKEGRGYVQQTGPAPKSNTRLAPGKKTHTQIALNRFTDLE